MDSKDLWIEEPAPGNPWSLPHRKLNLEQIKRLADGPIPGDDDLESAVNLAKLVHETYENHATHNDHGRTDEEGYAILRALRLVLHRYGIPLDLPWRDFSSFRTYWIAEGASGGGSWQMRREMLAKHFDPVFQTLHAREEEQSRGALASGVSPHPNTGWTQVDDEIAQLRTRFRTASGMQDYRDTGNRCVAVLEALSRQVYDHAQHGTPGQSEPPVDKTNIRLEAYINATLPGNANEELRGLVKKASALAHKVKHSPNADRRSAGIAADSVILIANIIRRLDS
ncbi:adenine nucleotide alpha hydrolase family protein [Micrococcus luteus]|uniref:hypothetical protein n=1 Tax=Micrococcus luteus TaxID=1270 RepID=UPI0033A92B91